MIPVTLLSILGTHCIALPLSPAFPPRELQYVMDHSQASMLLASSKFYKKAHDVALQGLSSQPRVIEVEKLQAGEIGRVEVSLGGPTDGQGGIMLYTSGTTSKPVSIYQHIHN